MSATHERQGHAPAPAVPVRDEVLRLGPEGQLVGIVSHPTPGKPRTSPAPAVLVLNAGVLHRVGPHRLHVALTRRLAALGLPGVRLDLGGIGDSTATSDAATFRESAVADTRAAMTGLADVLGARRFVIFGICAGADNALATALVDERVAGIVLVDAAVYATPRSLARELKKRLAAPGGLEDAARWGARRVRRRLKHDLARFRRGLRAEPAAEGRENPPMEAFRSQLASLADRGVRVLSIYAGMHNENYNDADQIFETFPELRGRIDRAYFPEANHTFTQLEDQAALLDTVERWFADRFG
jgi:pimeloyl-ACP methyl ester carboxylesterase